MKMINLNFKIEIKHGNQKKKKGNSDDACCHDKRKEKINRRTILAYGNKSPSRGLMEVDSS